MIETHPIFLIWRQFVQKSHDYCHDNYITDIPILIKFLCYHKNKASEHQLFVQIAEIINHSYKRNIAIHILDL